MRFNASILDPIRLRERAYVEAEGIFSKDSTRRNRTLEQVRKACLMGHAAELYLIDHCGFRDDTRPYKDVFDTEDEPVEVKVTQKEKDVPFVLKRCNEAAVEAFRKYPKILYIFIVNGYNGDYRLHGIYHWNGKEFINVN